MATHYVAQTAAGDEDGSTYADRMDVVDHNADTFGFAASDDIYLCDAITSQVIIPVSGATGDGNRITYKGDLSGHEGLLTAWSSSGALYGTEKNYIIIDGIEVKNGKNGISFLNSCSNITVKKCLVHDMDTDGAHGITVLSNAAEYINSNVIIGGANGDGNEVYNIGTGTGASDIAVSRASNFLISHNECYGGEVDTGIDGVTVLISDNGIIEYNELYDHQDATGPDYGEGGCGLKGVSNTIVQYNHIYNNRAAGVLFNQQYVGSGALCSNITVRYNYIHHNSTNIRAAYLDDSTWIYGNIIADSTDFHGVQFTPTGSHAWIYNNIFVNNHGSTNDKYQLFIGSGNNYYVFNNIFYSDSYERLVWKNSAASVYEFNNNQYYYTGGDAKFYWHESLIDLDTLQSTYGQEADGQEGDPKFTNVASDIFTLLSTSPCINQGADLGSSYDDALDPDNTDFTTFPPTVETLLQGDHGTAWEMGAYVYVDPSHTPYTRFRGIKTSKNYNLIGRFR